MNSTTRPAPLAVPRDPAPPVTPNPAPRTRLLLLCAVASAGLLWLSYFPVNCGWLAWFALVPLLALVRTTARPITVYLVAWLGGLAFYLPALQWMRVADARMYVAWIGVAVYCSLYYPPTLFFLRLLHRRAGLPLVVTLPAVWTALEFFRSWFITGFAWYLLGHTQHDFLPVIQFADLTGAWGVSFLVAAVNAVLFEALYRREWFRTRFVGTDAPPPRRFNVLLVQAGAVAAALLAAVGYGEWRLNHDAFAPGPRVALIQGNVPQQIRNDLSVVDLMATHYAALCDLAAGQRPKPDLIVWPETSFPGAWTDTDAGAPTPHPSGWDKQVEEGRSDFRGVVGPWDARLLLGLNSAVVEQDGNKRFYNSALLLNRDAEPLGRYDKIHCVPFGEYVPLRDWLPWMRYFAPYDFDYSVTPGRNATRFPLRISDERSFTFGAAICYEDTDPDRTRPYAGGDGKPPADFLVNISNDGWFDGTSEHDEHLAICRFRAIECRRAVARAVNMGVSALIDADGRVLAPHPVAGTEWDAPSVQAAVANRLRPLPEAEHAVAVGLLPADHKAAVWLASGPEALPTSRWAEYKKVAGVLLADVPIDHRSSLYARWGDWLPWGCWALVAAGVMGAFIRRRAPAR